MSKPRILLLDIETAPIIAHVWGLWDQRVGLNQIVKDSHMLSWTAKWHGSKELFYMDQRGKRNIEDDKALVKGLAKLISKADIIVTQNGISFDEKVLKGRMIIHGLPPIAGYKHFDTYRFGKRHFRFTSHKLEYMAKALGVKHRKLTIRKFDGHELWTQCLKGNPAAWQEMEKYNKLDVKVLEEIYVKMRPWDSRTNFDIYSDDIKITCTCGSTHHNKYGFVFKNTGKYQKYRCTECGRITRGNENLLSRKKRASLRKKA